MNATDWAYDKAVNGVPGLDSAYNLASDYLIITKQLEYYGTIYISKSLRKKR